MLGPVGRGGHLCGFGPWCVGLRGVHPVLGRGVSGSEGYIRFWAVVCQETCELWHGTAQNGVVGVGSPVFQTLRQTLRDVLQSLMPENRGKPALNSAKHKRAEGMGCWGQWVGAPARVPCRAKAPTGKVGAFGGQWGCSRSYSRPVQGCAGVGLLKGLLQVLQPAGPGVRWGWALEGAAPGPTAGRSRGSGRAAAR